MTTILIPNLNKKNCGRMSIEPQFFLS